VHETGSVRPAVPCARLERAVMAVLKDAPASIKTPDIGGSGTTASFVKAVTAEL